jgi:hypothetical protein
VGGQETEFRILFYLFFFLSLSLPPRFGLESSVQVLSFGEEGVRAQPRRESLNLKQVNTNNCSLKEVQLNLPRDRDPYFKD